jgi:hypothetical protein
MSCSNIEATDDSLLAVITIGEIARKAFSFEKARARARIQHQIEVMNSGGYM